MANLVLKNNSSATSTELTMEVKDKSTWKIINKAGTFIINSTNDLVTIDNTGKVNINKGHLYLNGAAGTSTGNTTQIIFKQGTTEHIALSSNDDAFVINPTSSSTTNQVVFYLGVDNISTLPSGLTISGTNGLTVSKATKLNSTLTVKDTATMRSITPEANNTYNLGTSSVKWANAYATTFHGALSGNASSATKLATARTLKIGNTGKTFDGSANVTWNNNEIGFYDLVNKGTEFDDKADLNSIGYGNYFANNSTKSATLINSPTTGAGFRLIHQRGYNASELYDWQFAYSSARRIYQRYRDGNGAWSTWGQMVLSNSLNAVGNATVPVYINSSGIATACSTYAGGTAVTLNGTSKSANTAGFYAPTSEGIAGYILKAGGSNTAPSWIQAVPIANGGTGKTSWTNNLMVYINSSNNFAQAHYISNTQVGIGYTSAPPTTFSVQGGIRAVGSTVSAWQDSATSAQVYAYNTTGSSGIIVTSDGNRGLYDRTNDHLVLYYHKTNGRYQQRSTYFTGNLYAANNAYVPSIYFESSSAADGKPLGAIRHIMQNSSTDTNYTFSAMYFYNYSYIANTRTRKEDADGNGIYERFKLPTTSAGLTASATYSILTTKNTVTIGQGGTGRTSWTKNRMVWADADGNLLSGNHWVDSGHVGINMTTAPSTVLGVGGSITASGSITSDRSDSTTADAIVRAVADTTDAWVQARNKNGTISLRFATNMGIYDSVSSKWMIYSVPGETIVRIPGSLTTPQIKLSSTSAVKHLEFSRGGMNYITTPASGSVNFCLNGAALSSDNCQMSVYPEYVKIRTPLALTADCYGDARPSSGSYTGQIFFEW